MLRNTLDIDEKGRRLLYCIRAYVELDLLASFEVHTEESIKYGRAAAEKFMKLANVSHLIALEKTSSPLMCSDK